MTHSEFLFPIIQRNLKLPEEEQKDTDAIVRRMDNPICKQCHEDYKKKFPGSPFKIECQGIYGEEDFKEYADLVKVDIDEIRELYDPVFWAERHINLPNQDGDLVAFVPRNYQIPILRCTARFQVDRMGRGLGKSTLGIIQELHKAFTKKNYRILIACPAMSQAKMWYDLMLAQIKNDPDLNRALVSKQQAPYYLLRISNGSEISIYTTGSKSGSDADTIRGASPMRVRLDEQDLLNPGDYKTIMPLLRRFPKESEFHGSSTPTGKRETFWEMCTKYKDYKEFYSPISVHPDWNEEMEETLRREARVEIVYQHEYLAEFGDQEGGVFKSNFVDAARQLYKYRDCCYDNKCSYFLGVDWNGQGTGTRLRVVEYNPNTGKRRCVDHQTVNTSNRDSINAVADMNRKWHCEEVYIDYGYGYVQGEFLREIGSKSSDADDKRLLDIKIIDFGASLTFNRLVPNRGPSKYKLEDEMERRTKPFIVEGAVMCLENGLFQFSEEDKVIDDQLRAYRVKTWSTHGWANTYESGTVGDHDLDALMLALLGIEMKYGIFQKTVTRRRPALALIDGFGAGSVKSIHGEPASIGRETLKREYGIPSRAIIPSSSGTDSQSAARIAYRSRNSFVAVPNRGVGSTIMRGPGGVPSRTAAIQKPGNRFGIPGLPSGRFPL